MHCQIVQTAGIDWRVLALLAGGVVNILLKCDPRLGLDSLRTLLSLVLIRLVVTLDVRSRVVADVLAERGRGGPDNRSLKLGLLQTCPDAVARPGAGEGGAEDGALRLGIWIRNSVVNHCSGF